MQFFWLAWSRGKYRPVGSFRSILRIAVVALGAGLCPALTSFAAAAVVDYDIVYVRQPRYGDTTNTIWPEVRRPMSLEPGADLMLLHPTGTEEVLVRGGVGAVTDPFISFDGQWVYYSYFYDVQKTQLGGRDLLPLRGADIFKLHLPTRRVVQLTFGEFTPNTGAGTWDESNPVNPPSGYNRLGFGIFNTGPCPVPGGRIAFTSSRNGFEPTKGATAPTMQLFVMDENGNNVEPIAPMTISSALHPTILRDGRIMFSSHEDQGLRDNRLWGIWAIYPDGRQWGPLASAFRPTSAFHFMTQMSNEDVVYIDYYNLNNNGFGQAQRMPIRPPAGVPGFHSARPEDNPPIWQQSTGQFRMSFTPRGLYSITPFTTAEDWAAPVGNDGKRVGKVTHPSAAPSGDLLLVWTVGPANDTMRPVNTPFYDGGIYLHPQGAEIWSPAELILIKNSPSYNEAWPRAVVPYSDIHGVDEPAQIAWLPNDGTLHPDLPPGTPYGLVGTSSFYKRESSPGKGSPTYDGLDVFNTSENEQSSNWFWQGSDAGKYANPEIWAVRLVALEPHTYRSYGPNAGRQFVNHANERMRILGEIPLRKFAADGSPILDPEGNPDTSFLARIPADTPFTFQTLDRNGAVLNAAQTWHQVRPGEVRTDCGGCHAHSQQPLDFERTAAARPDYQVWDLVHQTPLVTRTADGKNGLKVVAAPVVNVEFLRDIRPILDRSCVSCHGGSAPAGNLRLDDRATYTVASAAAQGQGSQTMPLPGDYARLAHDQPAQWGYRAVAASGRWRPHQASRYIRMLQSRRSLLTWKVFGKRMDGWTNADNPTETVPGDPATLPAGANPNRADLDYVGTCPAAQRVTEDERMTIARWIDLGAPINLGPYGLFLDDLKPTVHVDVPRAGLLTEALTRIRFGLADANSGVDLSTLSVLASFDVGCQTPPQQMAPLAVEVDDGVYEIQLPGSVRNATRGWVNVSVKDRQGNVTRVDREFWSAAARELTEREKAGVRGPKRTRTATATPTRFFTATPFISPTRTRTPTPGPSATRTRTATAGPSPTRTRTATAGPSPTRTRTPTPGSSPTRTRTATPSRTATRTATPPRTSTPTGPTPTPGTLPCTS